MFALFFSLYVAMFYGNWKMFTYAEIGTGIQRTLNSVGSILTSMFNNVETPINNLGDVLITAPISGSNIPNYLLIIGFVLALITSIGIVVMAVKGIKRVFGVFFMGIR